MESQRRTDQPGNRHQVTLIEGQRDLKPRPESYVAWPQGRPPGGPLPKTPGVPAPGVSPRQPAQNAAAYRKRFLIKVAGLNDQVGELGEEPLTASILTLLAAELNRNQTPLMLDGPEIRGNGNRPAPLSIRRYAGFIAADTAQFHANGPDGAGLYAEAEVMSNWAELVGSIIGSPCGIDFTASAPDSIASVNIVVQPRGAGKVIAQLR